MAKKTLKLKSAGELVIPQRKLSMLHKLHRISALIIGTYALFHIANHWMALFSLSLHIEFMEGYRPFYRVLPIEALLLTCFAYQVVSGIYFIKSRWGQRSGFFDKAQALSGGYLAFFLIVHVAAVLFGRIELNLDTNFYYAAAGMHIVPYYFFFFPYYFLAVVTIFTHVGCAIHWISRERFSIKARNKIGVAFIFIGIMLGGLIVLSFGGTFYEVQIPAEYEATYK